MSRCTVCQNSQVEAIDGELAAGSSIRHVSQLFGVPRSTVGRHRRHSVTGSRPVAPSGDVDGSTESHDPLDEAVSLAGKARTPRERLRALEQIRAATKLALRGRSDLVQEDRDLLEANVEDALLAYTLAPDFETSARALAGWREAIAQRLDATDEDEPFDIRYPTLSFPDDSHAMPRWLQNRYAHESDIHDANPPETYALPTARYWSGVPQRYRARTRFVVDRKITLSLQGPMPQAIRVYNADGALVWAKNR